MRTTWLFGAATAAVALLAVPALAAGLHQPVLTDAAGDANGLATVGLSQSVPGVNVASEDLLGADLTMPGRGKITMTLKLAALPPTPDQVFRTYLLDLMTADGCPFSLGVLTGGGGNAKPAAIIDAEGTCGGTLAPFVLDLSTPVVLDAQRREMTVTYPVGEIASRLGNAAFGAGAAFTGVGARVITGGGLERTPVGDGDTWTGVTMDAASAANFTLECLEPNGNC